MGQAGARPRQQPWEQRLHDLAQKVLAHFGRQAGNLQELLTAERLPVMTFHSLCAQLLRLAPQEAGIPLDFRLLEEDESRRLKEEALEELRRHLAARPDHDPGRGALVRRLVRLNNDWGRLAGELRALLARRDSLGDFLELARHSREPEAYHQLLEERFRLALAPVLQGLVDGFQGRRFRPGMAPPPGGIGRDFPRRKYCLPTSPAPHPGTCRPGRPSPECSSPKTATAANSSPPDMGSPPSSIKIIGPD